MPPSKTPRRAAGSEVAVPPQAQSSPAARHGGVGAGEGVEIGLEPGDGAAHAGQPPRGGAPSNGVAP
ncbi:MAG: hypothetical protein WKG00_24045, partial [Polyangiaceae bacterium]